MADGGFLEIDQKLQQFLSEPLGHKLVTEIPGLEGKHADRLKTKGIRKACFSVHLFRADQYIILIVLALGGYFEITEMERFPGSCKLVFFARLR